MILHILQTPYLLQSFSAIIMFSMFLGSLLYNGDVKTAYKALIGVGGYAFFVGLVNYYHLSDEGVTIDRWIQPLSILFFVLMAYIVGLTIGILIHWFVHKK